MNELLIGFILLVIIGVPMAVIEIFRELKEERYKSHREFLKNHPEYRINWRGDLIKRR